MWNLKINFGTVFWDILTLHPHNTKSILPTTGTFQYVESHTCMLIFHNGLTRSSAPGLNPYNLIQWKLDHSISIGVYEFKLESRIMACNSGHYFFIVFHVNIGLSTPDSYSSTFAVQCNELSSPSRGDHYSNSELSH